jgi:hypothetical protein
MGAAQRAAERHARAHTHGGPAPRFTDTAGSVPFGVFSRSWDAKGIFITCACRVRAPKVREGRSDENPGLWHTHARGGDRFRVLRQRIRP